MTTPAIKRIRLPRRRLCPRFVKGPETRRRLCELHAALPPASRDHLEWVIACRIARLDIERPARLMLARERLRACHWAGWDHSRDVSRWARGPGEHGRQGPKWLGAR